MRKRIADPRKHHYVPESYLIGFTPKQERDDFLYCIDKTNKTVRPAKPKKVASQRDYYRAEIGEKNAIETLLAQLEDKAIPIIRDIERDGEIPTGETYQLLLHFISFMYLRVPKSRDSMRKNLKEIGDLMVSNTLATKERWETSINQLRNSGEDIPDEPSYEQVKESFQKGRIICKPTKSAEIGLMLGLSIHLREVFSLRKWYLFKNPYVDLNIITNDCPVIPTWINAPPPGTPMGLALTNVDIFFPISRRAFLVGTYREGFQNALASRNTVLNLNSNVCLLAKRFIFSPCENPICLLNDAREVTIHHYLNQI